MSFTCVVGSDVFTSILDVVFTVVVKLSLPMSPFELLFVLAISLPGRFWSSFLVLFTSQQLISSANVGPVRLLAFICSFISLLLVSFDGRRKPDGDGMSVSSDKLV